MLAGLYRSSCTAQSSSIFDQLIALHVYHLLGTAGPGAWRRLEKYGRQRCDNAVTFLYSYVAMYIDLNRSRSIDLSTKSGGGSSV